MNVNEEREKIASFIRIGLIVLTTIAIFGIGIEIIPGALAVSYKAESTKLPIHSVESEKKQVAISFDVAWENSHTSSILETLKTYQVKATFFVTGDWMKEYPEEVLDIYNAGHDIGNHSENHKEMAKLTEEEMKKEVEEPQQRLYELTGQKMNLFRAPYGEYSDRLLNVLENLEYYCIQWDVDSFDWKDYDAKTIVGRIINSKQLKNGSIILMHNDGKYTSEALPMVIETLRENGYEIVPISKLIYKSNYILDRNGRQIAK